jgi:hypothetical protein
MNFEDSTVILDVLVKELFNSRFPAQAANEELQEAILSLYLDFAYDKTGYWATKKTAFLMSAQFNARVGDTPAEAAAVIIRVAREMLKLEAAEHRKNKRIISLALPLPRNPKHQID